MSNYTTMNNTSSLSSKPSMKRKRFSGNITDNISTSLPARKIVRVMSGLPDRMMKTTQNHNMIQNNQSVPVSAPQHVLESILSKKGMSSETYCYDQLQSNGFFVAAKDEEIKAWDFDVLRAIRDGDVSKLREFHECGRPLKCSNKFGESLLHLACRKGLVPVIDLLVNEVGVPVQVVDDMGRTPLHDAFWTAEPNFEVIDMIIGKCPDLLYVKDKRGHTPLNYTRQAHWSKWGEYLECRSEIIVCHSNKLNGRKQ